LYNVQCEQLAIGLFAYIWMYFILFLGWISHLMESLFEVVLLLCFDIAQLCQFLIRCRFSVRSFWGFVPWYVVERVDYFVFRQGAAGCSVNFGHGSKLNVITTIVIRGISIRFVFINVMQISNVCENFQIYLSI
jgi:hypothetical protein